MKLAAIAFSDCGKELAAKLLTLQGHEVQVYVSRRHCGDFEGFDSVYALVKTLWQRVDGLIFVGACGIAVRAVAPLIESKLRDCAVVVCDETGQFAISVLSGHAGGANALAEQVAAHIGAQSVVTTASDCHTSLEGGETKKNLILGIGCRRGLAAELIERTATILLWEHKIPLARVAKAATIDIKQDETGLLNFAKAHDLPLHFYSAEELAALAGEFHSSQWVLDTVGVDSVCERAAARCGGEGTFILRKCARNGITVAVFEPHES